MHHDQITIPNARGASNNRLDRQHIMSHKTQQPIVNLVISKSSKLLRESPFQSKLSLLLLWREEERVCTKF